ncbi:hypothetical protein HAX54_022183 [Datura stramonium]|uniref:Uncharacterized protein n=1 Tax=Datura stramonium TaxID=4076 RepID=A0ABS8UTV0_DATST|nr:hypothetical protein [Datura stramonium]
MVTKPGRGALCGDHQVIDKMWHREGKKDAMLLVMMKQMELLTNYMKGFHARCNQENHEYDYAYYGNQGWNNARSVDTSSQGSNESIPPHIEKNDIFEWEIEEEVVGELIADVFFKGEELEEVHHVGQASMPTNTPQVRFRLEGMEEFYLAFKEKRVIHAEAQFDIESFKTACPYIYHQTGTRDWGPFTIPVDLYLPELVWEFYASYRARQQLMKRRGRTEAFSCLTSVCLRLMPSMNTSKVPIEVFILLACLMDHVHINVEEIIVDQFKWKAKQQATAFPFPNLVFDVLESKVGSLKQEVAALSAPSSIAQPNPCEPEVIPEAPRSPPDDWWVGYNSGVATTSYYELDTLPDNWVVQGPGKPLSLPPDPHQPTAEETASWQFDAATYTWKPRPNH